MGGTWAGVRTSSGRHVELRVKYVMPEGPEIRLSALFVNHVCQDRTFSGQPEKSSVSKNPEVAFTSPRYSILSEARGKEMALFLECCENSENKTRLLFRFGMSGRFRFTPAKELVKHSHLVFYTNDSPQMALSFVDPRRFGSWCEIDDWGIDRGPDAIAEFEAFSSNVVENLHLGVFDKPICEVMLNQKYFNGVGNYLRAEILYRSKIPPFAVAREALTQHSASVVPASETDQKERSVILNLCHHVQLEVVNMKTGLGKSKDCSVSEDDYRAFMSWLQCYENSEMKNLVDHNGRTIWFDGDPGSLVPKVRKSRGKKKKASQEEDGDDIPAPKTRKLKNRQSTTGSPPSAIITDKKKKTKLSPLSKGGNKRNPHGKSRDTQLKETDAQDSGIKTEERYTPQGVASAKRRSSNTNKVFPSGRMVTRSQKRKQNKT